MSADIAVAVVSTNMRDLLRKTLESLAPEQAAGRVEPWVVDNASTDGSADMVREEFPDVKLIALEQNVGYGRAINMVAERTETPWVAPANEDIEVRPGAIERLLETGAAHPEAAVIAPRLVLPDGSTQHSVFAFPTLPLTLAVNLGIARRSRRLGDRLCLEGLWDPEREREVPWAIATFFICRRSAWDEVGGFDREQFIHAEDLDLEWRLRERGWRARYVPGAEVFHVGSAATKKAFGDELMSRYMAASYAWMARRRGLATARTIAFLNAAGAALRLAVFGALAAVRPARFGPARDQARYWLGVHRVGLKPREELLEHR